jgi:hypothetical protein
MGIFAKARQQLLNEVYNEVRESHEAGTTEVKIDGMWFLVLEVDTEGVTATWRQRNGQFRATFDQIEEVRSSLPNHF